MLREYLIEKQAAHYRAAYSYTKNKEDALDVLQDSIEKALRSYGKKVRPDHLNAWFYRILVNTAIDYLRRRKKVLPLAEETLEALGATEDRYENLDLKEALEALPEPYVGIVHLRFYEDMKIAEIAEVLGENENTIKTRLYRGLALLKVEMEEENHA